MTTLTKEKIDGVFAGIDQLIASATSLVVHDKNLLAELKRLALAGLGVQPRPIEEAPKDGTEILALTARGRSEVVFFDEISKTWIGPYTSLTLSGPSHFVDVPAIPTPEVK